MTKEKPVGNFYQQMKQELKLIIHTRAISKLQVHKTHRNKWETSSLERDVTRTPNPMHTKYKKLGNHINGTVKINNIPCGT
jgi:hypothetical protein